MILDRNLIGYLGRRTSSLTRAVSPRRSSAIRARDSARRCYGEGHLDYAVSLSNLAMVYRRTGEYTLADSLYLQAIEISHGSGRELPRTRRRFAQPNIAL